MPQPKTHNVNKPIRHRSPSQIAKHRKLIAEYYLHGMYQYEIAEEIGLDQATISRDLKAIQKEWLKSTLRDFDELKAQELAKIDDLEITYRDGWNTSKDENTVGDPRFLNGIDRCIERRCKLLGLDAPIKHKDVSEPQKVLHAVTAFNELPEKEQIAFLRGKS